MKKYFLTENLSDINTIINAPLQQTQRIKFTCFDVSSNYIVYGASSGGLYIFRKTPCEFLKLVPSKEGSVSHVTVSSNEKMVAIASSKGIVIVVVNCFDDSNLNYQIFTEHTSSTVKSLKWHGNDLYCGCSAGKVSVITINNILTKSIFQNPSAILMQLESSITQLDLFSKYLLVSTTTKTYLCDTEAEQYRQIGKKLRDGEYGACFFTESTVEDVNVQTKQKNIFKVLTEGESFSNLNLTDVKIFCMRPGLRIWEADFEGSVVCTHQFKDRTHQNNTDIIKIGEDVGCRLKISKISPFKGFHNFGYAFIVLKKFLLTYSTNSIFVFEMPGVKLLFKCNLYRNIKSIKEVDGNIYVWDGKDLRHLSIDRLETLLLRSLAKKQYSLCSEICLKFPKDLNCIMESSTKLSSLVILKDKIKDENILNKLNPILEKLKEQKTITKGIIKVENGHVGESSSSNYNYDNIEEQCDQAIFESDPTNDLNLLINVLNRQYQVNKMYSNIETPQLYETLYTKSLDEIVDLFNSFSCYILESDSEDPYLIRSWCYNQYLYYFSKKFFIKDLDVDSKVFKYIFEGFKHINIGINSSDFKHLCLCSFPLPNVRNLKIRYFNIGCDICKKLSEKDIKLFCIHVPYMWKCLIPQYINDINMFLPLLLQFSDIELLEEYCKGFTCDKWEEAIRLLIKLKSNKCLNCDRNVDFDVNETITWKEFSSAMISSKGALTTVQLLKRYSKFIPNNSLGIDFYQHSIFNTIIGEDSTKFLNAVYTNEDLNVQFNTSLNKYINDKYMGSTETKETLESSPKCTYCDLKLKPPIFDGISIKCGHIFHKICFYSMNKKCCICEM